MESREIRMESGLLGVFKGLFHPVVAAIVVGVLGFILYGMCSKQHKVMSAKSDFELASMSGTKHTIAAVFLVVLSLYALILTGYVMFAAFVDMGTSTILYGYAWVTFNRDPMYDLIFVFGAFQLTYASVMSCLRIINIDAVMREARKRQWEQVLSTLHPASSSDASTGVQAVATAPQIPIPEVNDVQHQPTETPAPERTEPVTYTDILQSLQQQLIDAMKEAQQLRNELDETREKVVVLEDQVQAKDEWIQEIESGTASFREHLNATEAADDDGKQLNLTDSVMVGDSIMGGVKIDKQINNDPDAIARAVLDAYRAGRGERED